MIVTVNGVEIKLTSKYEIEQALIVEHTRKYHQTEGFCPLLEGSLLTNIGLLGNGPHADNILQGLYVAPEGTPDGTKVYLQALQRPQRFSPIQ